MDVGLFERYIERKFAWPIAEREKRVRENRAKMGAESVKMDRLEKTLTAINLNLSSLKDRQAVDDFLERNHGAVICNVLSLAGDPLYTLRGACKNITVFELKLRIAVVSQIPVRCQT